MTTSARTYTTPRDSTWATVDWVEVLLKEEDASFDPSQYGSDTLAGVVRATGYFEIADSTAATLKLRDPHAKKK